MLPISIAALAGWMSISVSQPSAVPVRCGRTAQAIGSWVAAKPPTKPRSAASDAKGP